MKHAHNVVRALDIPISKITRPEPNSWSEGNDCIVKVTCGYG